MDYLKVYNSIIENAKLDAPNRVGVIVERHHIVPKCIGGTNDPSNIVALTPREHFICHWLLWKGYKHLHNSQSVKLGYAFISFQRKAKHLNRSFITSNEYESIRVANVECGAFANSGKNNPMYGKPCFYKMTEDEKNRWKENIGKSVRGEKNPFYGKHHTEETKKKLSEIQTGNHNWDKMSEEAKQRFYDMAKRPKSEEHRKKIGRKNMINLRNIHTNERIRVYKDDPIVQSEDWVPQNKGITLKKTHTCPYCGIITDKAHYNRWHGENCKKNPNKK